MSTDKTSSKDLTLVVLAAGMGSRYGGLKQLDTFSSEDDTILDFSIYDAIQAGFTKLVFVIREHLSEEFKAIFESKLAGKISVIYVFQEIDRVPKKYSNANRTKPWGTGHALIMTKDVINENFAIINADDFYGRDSFFKMAQALKSTDPESYRFTMVAFKLKNTISEYGSVSRGECTVTENGYLKSVTERTHIEKKGADIFVNSEDGTFETIDPDTFVSMNFWGFTPKCFEFGTELFSEFLEKNQGDLKAEFYIPTVVNEMLRSSQVRVNVLSTRAKWFGVTYKEDKAMVQKAIQGLKDDGTYPVNLWQ